MAWLNKEIAERWRIEGKRYASEINKYVQIGMEQGWSENLETPKEDQRSSFATKIVEMIRAANRAGETKILREEIPPSSWPITSKFEDQLQPVKPVAFLKDGSLLVHVGGLGLRSTVYMVNGENLDIVPGVSHAGGSRDGAYVALVNEQGIQVVSNMTADSEGEEVTAYSWQDVQRKLKESISDFKSLADEEHPESVIEEVIPFNEGRSLLLVSRYGIYLLGVGGEAELLHPALSELKEFEIEDTIIDMVHGDVSPDGRWLAYGSQSREHLLKDMRSGEVFAFEPTSSYPHFARFSKDNGEVWYNACHFYNGSTFKVPLKKVEEGFPDGIAEEWPEMNEEMRVYAAAALKEGHILGDAYGYLKLIDGEGHEIWRYFVGSTIFGMTVSADEKILAVGTYGGMLHLLRLDSGEKSEYSIGTAPILETDRWLLWKNQEPLRW
ncbi:hypothetical protein [Paenibacillus sp. UMB4589-SE434]|uniref:hypothetical protein n=1 Tax=Paenibacillus sp. UMB4589-SE434 TaxID=3046314 RepID=UPI0025503F4A|nr:hypothetical protein [Paenibacillus sp. UMB4589-SE434]MDK8180322.1 hypothetical protein [Paenibacillus sp. UMB4589-SE434]